MGGMALRGLPSPQHPAVSLVMRTVPFFTSVPLNCYSQERIHSLVPALGSVSSWAFFCSKYEAFSSPGEPDLGKWRNHVAGTLAGLRAHCLGLRPAHCSQELGPMEEGPAADQAGRARHAQAGAARQREAGGMEVGPHVQLGGCHSEIQRGKASQAPGRVSEMGYVAQ